ncbi:MAG: SH3-like domain-containing protein [Vulcanimicrobiaceae bacterium]
MSARFAVGDRVRVDSREHAGHVRTPHYIRGKIGAVERICGTFRNPEDLAYGRWTTAPLPLYRVRFRQAEVWPDYDGPAADTLDVEIYEHWLENAIDDPSA